METYTVKVDTNGNRYWWQNGQRHREDGPAIENASGYRSWFQNGQRHRVDGPAIEYTDGTRIWYQNGHRHRLDGPAVEYMNGDKEWWINNKKLTQEEFNKTQKSTCENKTVIIDGITYKLVKE